METRDLLPELQKRVRELEAFDQIGKTVTSTLEIKQVLQVLMDHITRLLDPNNWSMLLTDEEKQEIYFEIVVGEGAEVIKKLRLKMGEGICGWVALHQKPLLIADVNKDQRFSKKADKLSNFKTEAIVCVPMVSKGKTLGVIELINKKSGGGEFTEEDLKILTSIADYAAIAIENAYNYRRIHELTIKDDLTKLYNSRHLHTLLDREIEKARQEKTHLSLIFIDLDHFKSVNDTHGHLVGSQLLRELGDVILEMLGDVYIGTRYGGDEFVLILPNTTKEKSLEFAHRLRDKVNDATFLEKKGLFIKVTASFGLASLPEDAKSKDELVRLADDAMYRVKAKSRNGIEAA